MFALPDLRMDAMLRDTAFPPLTLWHGARGVCCWVITVRLCVCVVDQERLRAPFHFFLLPFLPHLLTYKVRSYGTRHHPGMPRYECVVGYPARRATTFLVYGFVDRIHQFMTQASILTLHSVSLRAFCHCLNVSAFV